MPRLTTWFIRAGLIYLTLGFTVGALLLFHKGVPLHPGLWRLLPLHIEFLLMGWTVQLVFGVAFWILPRFQQGNRGNELAAWLAFGLINLGVGLVGVGTALTAPAWLLLLGRVAEAGAAAAFATHAWPRIRPFGQSQV